MKKLNKIEKFTKTVEMPDKVKDKKVLDVSLITAIDKINEMVEKINEAIDQIHYLHKYKQD